MTSSTTPSSGTFSTDRPALFPYPRLLPLGDASLSGVYCHIIRHYGTVGLSLLVKRIPQKDQIAVCFGDWLGHRLDLSRADEPLVARVNQLTSPTNGHSKLAHLLSIMRYARLEQAQFFFAICPGLVLCDIQIAQNKLASAGMISELFGRAMDTQEIIATEVIDARAAEYIERGTGKYAGNLILKPTTFRLHQSTQEPLYAEVLR